MIFLFKINSLICFYIKTTWNNVYFEQSVKKSLYIVTLNAYNIIKLNPMHISQVKEYNPESNHTDKTIQRSIYVSNPTLTNQYSTPTKFSNTMNFSQTKNSLKKSTSTIDPYS